MTTILLPGGNPPGRANAFSTRYHFFLVAEDQARNLSPGVFDSRRIIPVLPATQSATALMPACPGCFAGGLGAVTLLRGVKREGAAEFHWLMAPAAEEYHLNTVPTSRSNSRASRRGGESWRC